MNHLLCILIISLVLTASDTTQATTPADSLYQIAVQSLNSASVEESINAFQRVIKARHNDAPAYDQLAKLYLRQNTVGSRQRAENAIRKAIRADANNEAYQLTLGDVLWAQGFRFNSSRQFKKVLDENPKSARAAYQVGFQALKQYLKYQDMIDYEGENRVRMEWAHFAEEDRQDAIAHFQISIKADPDFASAYYHLGLVHYENNQPENLLAICKQLIAHKPEDKNAYLYSGLAYQRLENYDEAYACYTRAMANMATEERAVMESVTYLADETDRQYLASLPAKNGKGELTTWTDARARERFWRPQDPLHITPYNERQMAHYGRVAYANLRFGRPEKNIEGWQTDMGRFYIRYGRWLSKLAQRPEVSPEGVLTPHTETWFYEDFMLTFRNRDGLDAWRIEDTFDNNRNYHTASADEFTRHKAARFVDPYREHKYSVPNLIAAFRQADSVRIEMAYALPKDKLDGNQISSPVEMDTGIFLYDNDWQSIQRHRETFVLKYPANTPQTNWRLYALQKTTLYTTPGTYHLIGEMRNLSNRSIGTFDTHQAFAFPDTGLAVSDLLLASHIAPLNPFPQSRADLNVQPNPLRAFDKNHPVFIYLEVYNLQRDPYGRTRYDMAYQLSVPDKNEVDPTLFDAQDLPEGNLIITPRFDDDGNTQYDVRYTLPERNRIGQSAPSINQSGDRIETTVSAEYEGETPDDFTFLEIDVHPLPEGVYKLTVTVTDQKTGATAQKSTLFRVGAER